MAEQNISTGLLKVDHNELKKIIDVYYKNKLFLMIYGTFGIGKSQVIKSKAIEISKIKKKEFVEWNKIKRDKKLEIIKDPSKYFVFIDERLSEYDSTDSKGLPNILEGSDTIDWKIPLWSKLVTTPNSDGFLFFDEMNLANNLVISSIYKVVLDRITGDSSISPDWLILGAGNNEEDRAQTFEMPPPIKDRGGELQLAIPNLNDWTSWAAENGIDNRIITFLNWKESYLHQVDHDKSNKFTTPRGYERLSKLIKGIKDYDILELVSMTAIGRHIASEFVSYCRIKEKIDLKGIINKPSKLKKMDGDNMRSTLYFLIGSVAEMYGRKEVKFEKILEFMEILDELGLAEFSVILLRICYLSSDKFKQDFTNCDSKVVDKFAKHLVG